MRRPPRYVHGYVDRHGKARFYFRREGFKRMPLPGLPWSPEFMAAYDAALAGQWPATFRQMAKGSHARPGSVRWLAVSWYNSIGFRSMKPTTRSTYRNIAERLCIEHGDKRAALLQREHIVKLMAARAEQPDSANGLRKVLRAMMRHAIDIGVRADDPTRDVRSIRVNSDGFHSWTDAEISQFEARHPIGSRARLAFALLLFTGQRRSDVVRMGRQHIRDGALTVRQQKTGAELEIPVLPELAAIVQETQAEHLTFLTTQFGEPFTAAGFGNWFREQCDMANLHHCSAHGLRKAAARRLAEAGCTEHEIASITGHVSLREVERYTKAVDQKRLAVSAMAKTRTGIG